MSDDRGANTVIVAPVPNAKTKLNNEARKHEATKQMAPPSRRRGRTQTGWRMQTPRGLGALLPGLSSSCCIFNGVHTDIISLIAPKGVPKRKQKGQSKRERRKNKQGKGRRTGRDEREKHDSARERIPPVVEPRYRLYRLTLHPGGGAGNPPPKKSTQVVAVD